MFFRKKRSGDRVYLQLVENERVGGKVRQRLVASLGRYDELEASGQLARLSESVARLTQELEAVRLASDLEARSARPAGGLLALDRLWKELGLDRLLRKDGRERGVEYDYERAIFAMVANRVLEPRSKRGVMDWLATVAWPEDAALELQHLYRALDVLADTKDALERRLHDRVRDLFQQRLDLVLYDTTSVSFQTDTESDLLRRGHSKDHRPDLPQAVVGLLMSGDGIPIAHEVFAGNTYDGNTVPHVLKALTERFQLRWLIFVADRGMVSRKNLELLEEAGYDWIVGVRMRNRPEIGEVVLEDTAPFEAVAENLEVKEVEVGERRYIVCHNPVQARRDAARREAMIGNRGYRRFVRVQTGSTAIDWDKVEADARYDGIWIVETSTELAPDEVAQAYKSLWRVERAFRTLKNPLQLRPVRHWTERRIRGHIAMCFLAFLLRAALERRFFDEADIDATFRQILDALQAVQEVRLDVKGTTLRLFTQPSERGRQAFRALGMRPPPRIQTPA